MIFMIFVVLSIVLISPQKDSLQLKDLFMYPLWLGVIFVTIGDWAFYKIRKKEVKTSNGSSWYYIAFLANVATYPILNIVANSLLTFLGYQVSIEEIFANSLQGHPLSLFFDTGGYTCFVLGSLLFFSSKLYLRSMWSALVAEIKTDHKLVTNGIYRFVRHPMYGGAILMCIGQGLLLHNPLVIIYDLLVVLPLWYKSARIEEYTLEKEFGIEYSEYRKTVPMFFPLSFK